MNLSEYFQRLQAKLRTTTPDDESILVLLYEAFSESNAMYDDEIKADFHALYERPQKILCNRQSMTV